MVQVGTKFDAEFMKESFFGKVLTEELKGEDFKQICTRSYKQYIFWLKLFFSVYINVYICGWPSKNSTQNSEIYRKSSCQWIF